MVPENIHTSPTEGIGNSGEEGGVSKTQKFKAMYEAKLEFLERWGVKGQIPSVAPWQGVWIFSGTTHYVKLEVIMDYGSAFESLSCEKTLELEGN